MTIVCTHIRTSCTLFITAPYASYSHQLKQTHNEHNNHDLYKSIAKAYIGVSTTACYMYSYTPNCVVQQYVHNVYICPLKYQYI